MHAIPSFGLKYGKSDVVQYCSSRSYSVCDVIRKGRNTVRCLQFPLSFFPPISTVQSLLR